MKIFFIILFNIILQKLNIKQVIFKEDRLSLAIKCQKFFVKIGPFYSMSDLFSFILYIKLLYKLKLFG